VFSLQASVNVPVAATLSGFTEVAVHIKFEHVRDLLELRDWEMTAAELHGSLCGFLSARGQLRDLDWLDVLVNEPVSAALAVGERQVFSTLGEVTSRGLEEGELGFHPLLPDDEQDLSQRVAALNQWCDGFVGGLGLGGLDDQHGLSETGREAVEDLGRIARTELTLDGDEADEGAFVEVLEFVRIGAILVYEELRATRLLRSTTRTRQEQHGRDRPH
jgi:uncharacterized protein YgfB (UPF0149 family)